MKYCTLKKNMYLEAAFFLNVYSVGVLAVDVNGISRCSEMAVAVSVSFLFRARKMYLLHVKFPSAAYFQHRGKICTNLPCACSVAVFSSMLRFF